MAEEGATVAVKVTLKPANAYDLVICREVLEDLPTGWALGLPRPLKRTRH